MCPDVIKDLNVKVFNLTSRTNKTRFIEWHETCKCKCRLDAIVCNNKRWNKHKYICECKELIDKGFFWNPSSCASKCDFGEYLDYENCKCRKKLVPSLIEECTETVEEVKLAKRTLFKNENSHKCSPCAVYILLLLIFLTISIGGIVTYYVYFQLYLKKELYMLTLILKKRQQFTECNSIEHINEKSQTN